MFFYVYLPSFSFPIFDWLCLQEIALAILLNPTIYQLLPICPGGNVFAFAPYGQGFESWSGLVFFSMYAIEILFPVKIELSDFCLSAQILSALLPHREFSLF